MMNKAKISVFLLILFLGMTTYATTATNKKVPIEIEHGYKSVLLGPLEETDISLIINQHSYPLYSVNDRCYIPLSYLKQAGINVEEEESIYYLRFQDRCREAYKLDVKFSSHLAYMNDKPIYCGLIRSYCLKADNEYLVPLEALEGLGKFKTYEGAYVLEEEILEQEDDQIAINETSISNLSDHILSVSGEHVYWDGKTFRHEYITYLIEPQASVPKKVNKTDTEQYVTLLPQEINWESLPSDHTFGQCDESFFSIYSRAVRYEALQKCFPPYVIKATMKYGVANLKTNEQVELWRAEKRAYYIVKDRHKKQVQVPYNSVKITEDWGAWGQKVTDEDIADFITLSGIESKTDYFLWTDVHRQRTYALHQIDGKWQVEKKFVCSTGKNVNPTPVGLYEVQYTIPYIGIEKGYRCKYALVFYRDYMFHSVLFDKSGTYIKSGQYELGRKASHGCVQIGRAHV